MIRAIVGGLLITGWLFCGGCGQPVSEAKPELLIYCGITMIRPVSDIAKIIEEEENCRIVITKGGSGNLLRSIKANKVGDLYLPGSDSYMHKCQQEGLVDQTVFAGYNKAAMMVQKGNPRGITASLDNLTNSEYYVVLGNPDSGSIGKETKRILENAGIYEDALANVRELTTDSKDLVRVLQRKEADLVVNWYATAVWRENEPYMDVLPIDDVFANPKKLVMGRLIYSSYPDLAQKFLDYVGSDKGKALFKKYGFIDIE